MSVFKKFTGDRRRVEEFGKAVDFINGYLQKFNAKITEKPTKIGKDGYIAATKLTHRGIVMEAVVLLPEGKAETESDLIFRAGVRQPPSGANLLPIYQQLLRWNDMMTGVTHFAIDSKGVILVSLRRPIQGLDVPEFEHAVVTVSENTATAIRLLRSKFNV